jgi:hypothetical protein
MAQYLGWGGLLVICGWFMLLGGVEMQSNQLDTLEVSA